MTCRVYRLVSAGAASVRVSGTRATVNAYSDGGEEKTTLGLSPGKSPDLTTPQRVQMTLIDTGLYTIRVPGSVRQVALTVRQT